MTINTTAPNTIEGTSSVLLTINYSSVTVASNPNDTIDIWMII
jgi:hypothetical protein